MAARTQLRHNRPMTAVRITSAPLRLTLDEARTLRAACAGGVFFSAERLAPIVAKLDVLLVALDEELATLPPPPPSPRMPREIEDPYCQPWVVALRKAPHASVCIDDECELSGSYAHVGPCEPCGCPLLHAVDECPLLRLDVCLGCKGRGVLVCRACAGIGVHR
jgi:hypothetical protein